MIGGISLIIWNIGHILYYLQESAIYLKEKKANFDKVTMGLCSFGCCIHLGSEYFLQWVNKFCKSLVSLEEANFTIQSTSDYAYLVI